MQIYLIYREKSKIKRDKFFSFLQNHFRFHQKTQIIYIKYFFNLDINHLKYFYSNTRNKNFQKSRKNENFFGKMCFFKSETFQQKIHEIYLKFREIILK